MPWRKQSGGARERSAGISRGVTSKKLEAATGQVEP